MWVTGKKEEIMFKRKACAAAVLAAAAVGPAWAQTSSVTLYGIADAAMEYRNNAPSGSENRMRSGGLSGGRLGVRGSEDLGGGMRAQFTMESGLEIDTGSASDPNRFWNRQSFVGLGGRWGDITLGRQYTAGFLVLAGYMPKGFALLYEPVATVITARVNNAIVYDGKFDAIRVRAHYSLKDGSNLVGGDGSTYGVAATVDVGQGSLAAVYDDFNGSLTANGRSKRRLFALAGKYQMDPVTLQAGWRQMKAQTETGAVALRDRFWWLGAAVRVTPLTELSVAYYRNDIAQRGPAFNPPTPQQLSLWAIYSLSKRTQLYAAVAHARNAPLNFGFGGYTLGAGKDSQTGFALGMRHTF